MPIVINFLFSPSRRSLGSCWLYVQYSAKMANKRIFINAMGKRHQRFPATSLIGRGACPKANPELNILPRFASCRFP